MMHYQRAKAGGERGLILRQRGQCGVCAGAGSGGAVGLEVGARVLMGVPLRLTSGETLLLTKRATLANFLMSSVGSSSVASMAPMPGYE